MTLGTQAQNLKIYLDSLKAIFQITDLESESKGKNSTF